MRGSPNDHDSIFHVYADACGSSNFRAVSWEEAMIKADEYMAKTDYGANQFGTRRVSYTVYRLPADTRAETGRDNYVSAHVLVHCQSRSATHTQEPIAPDCLQEKHEYMAVRTCGIVEGPGISVAAVRGDSIVIEDRCKHCGLLRVINTKYGITRYWERGP